MRQDVVIHTLSVEGYSDVTQKEPYILPAFSFSFLLEGEVMTEVDGKNILTSAGHLLLVPENVPITIRHLNAAKGFDGYFTMNALKDASYSVLRSREPVHQCFWFDDALFMGALFKRMVTAVQDTDKAFLQSGLDLILSQIRPTSGKTTAIEEQFLQLVFERGKAPATVSEYARMLNVSPNYLNKTVKAHTHRTAIDWIEIARVNLSKKLLKDPEVPVSEVAARVGIDDQSYFARFFKKQTGMTPSEFRTKG